MQQKAVGFVCILTTTAIGLLSASAPAATPITTTLVVNQLERPIFVTHAPGDLDRLFVIEKRGRIRVVLNGTLLQTPFLNIDPEIGGGTTNASEQGLLGLAFDPAYADNGYFYVNFTDNAGDTVVRRYTVSTDPNVADANSGYSIHWIDQPQANHNGGWLDFGPKGMLHVSTGDGGGQGDDDAGHTKGVGNSQDITGNHLGKILRLDVTRDDFPADPIRNYGLPPDNPFFEQDPDGEIWAFGLRNPWRPSFDRITGDLWIADVGQLSWEEVNFQSSTSPGGENYGWRCREGQHDFNTNGDCSQTPFTDPIHEYSHSVGCSVTGGYVYRGCAIPDLRGAYFFADYCTGAIWSMRYNGLFISDFQNRTSELAPGGGLSIFSITSMGEDAAGELYICDQSGGEVFQIIPDGVTPVLGDHNGDSLINQTDSNALPPCLLGPDNASDAAGCGSFDFDCDADVDLRDFAGFQEAFDG
jgi:glucose/arabinose dehydrogenase